MTSPMSQGGEKASAGGARRLRADAERNRAQVLTAARQVFLESGTAAPLDEIARRAGVNIATLYRRFPDRGALIRQVVLDGFRLVLETAQVACRTAQSDPLGALESYVLELIAQRDMLVLPLVGGPVVDDPEIASVQREIDAALADLLAAGREAGVVGCDVTVMDVVITSTLVCRPLPHLPRDQATALVTRHVRIFLGGLGGAAKLPAAPTYAELTARLRAAGEAADSSTA
ncbi:TetR/AcrR family transcriptional regulator [Streptomyces yunnanensis]|uniref:TetR/AcrR family transcriptional regulator n=1 Tax=Streptomyces yunnanensis TaxID=156453 RepID=UPI002570B6C3|nr:TetR/AcrR family transcriptional regulator [Streptomyces yunnanensis]